MSEVIHVMSERRHRALEATDAAPANLRRCINEYGPAIVTALVDAGVTEPRKIDHLVNTIWHGARAPSQRLNPTSGQTQASAYLDWLLLQSGSSLTAATLVRALWSNHLAIMPLEPSPRAVQASMDADWPDWVSKPEKHKRRLRAALLEAALRMWPSLGDPA